MTLSLIIALALRVALLCAIAGCVATLRRNASASERHLVWMLAIGAMLVLPVATNFLPAIELAALPASSAAQPGVIQPIEQESVNWLTIVQVIWLGGSVLCLIGLIAAHLRARGIIQRSSMNHAWSRAIGHRVLMNDEATFAFNYGIATPAIVLPAKASDWPTRLLHATLVHEAAHIARRDSLSLLLSQIARVVYWWHPAVWFAAREAAAERERACDDAVLRNGIRATEYGEHLLLNRTSRQAVPILVAAPLFSHSDGLANRISSLLDERVDHRPVRRSAVFVSLAIALPLLTVTASATPVSRHLSVAIASVLWSPVVAQAPSAPPAPVVSPRESKKIKTRSRPKVTVTDTAATQPQSSLEKKLAEGTWIVDGRVVDAASFPVDVKKMARLAGEMGRLAGAMKVTIDSAKLRPAR